MSSNNAKCGCCDHGNGGNGQSNYSNTALDASNQSQNEIIYISLGQAGVQMSHAAWELFCLEHGITADGKQMVGENECGNERQDVFFYQASSERRVPRSVLSDLEPSVVDEIRVGAYRGLHHPECLLTGMEDAASNYARGHFSIGKLQMGPTLTQIRRQAERCESLQGFMFTCGLGGGTGAGFSALILERLNTEYGKKSKVLVNIFPGPTMSNAMVEPYNVTLSMHSAIEFTDVNVTFDNEAVYKVCQTKLNYPRPTYNHVNRLMAQVLSAMTCSLRFPSALNSDLCQLQTNLVPFPRIHFPLVCYSPITSTKTLDRDRSTPVQVVLDLFDPASQLVSCDTGRGKFMACNLQFRGMVSPREMCEGIAAVKKNENLKFVDWCPTGFKVGICSQPPMIVPGSEMGVCNMNCTMMANSTAVGQVWEKLQKNFSVLFAKRAFVHWYVGEGMEEGEFNEALEDVSDLIKDYNTVAQTTQDEGEGEGEGEGEPELGTTEAFNTTEEEPVVESSNLNETYEQPNDEESAAYEGDETKSYHEPEDNQYETPEGGEEEEGEVAEGENAEEENGEESAAAETAEGEAAEEEAAEEEAAEDEAAEEEEVEEGGQEEPLEEPGFDMGQGGESQQSEGAESADEEVVEEEAGEEEAAGEEVAEERAAEEGVAEEGVADEGLATVEEEEEDEK